LAGSQPPRAVRQRGAQPTVPGNSRIRAPQQIQKLQSDLQVATSTAEVFRDLFHELREMPQQLLKNELLTELHTQCSEMQQRIGALLSQVEDEAFLVQLLEANDTINAVLEEYDQQVAQQKAAHAIQQEEAAALAALVMQDDFMMDSSQSSIIGPAVKKTGGFTAEEQDPESPRLDDEEDGGLFNPRSQRPPAPPILTTPVEKGFHALPVAPGFYTAAPVMPGFAAPPIPVPVQPGFMAVPIVPDVTPVPAPVPATAPPGGPSHTWTKDADSMSADIAESDVMSATNWVSI